MAGRTMGERGLLGALETLGCRQRATWSRICPEVQGCLEAEFLLGCSDFLILKMVLSSSLSSLLRVVVFDCLRRVCRYGAHVFVVQEGRTRPTCSHPAGPCRAPGICAAGRRTFSLALAL